LRPYNDERVHAGYGLWEGGRRMSVVWRRDLRVRHMWVWCWWCDWTRWCWTGCVRACRL